MNSSSTSLPTLEYAPADEFDVGRFVARYLQVLACASIVWMVLNPLVFDEFEFDLSPIFLFWAASALKRRSATARKWIIVIFTWALILCAYTIVHALAFGTEHMTIRVGRRIHDPSILQVFAIEGGMAVLVGVPLVVLLSKRARRQFARDSRAESAGD